MIVSKHLPYIFSASFIIFLLLLCMSLTTAQNDDEDLKPQPTRFVWDFRTVHWCVTGRDEPGLHKWPFSQFIPILRRTNRFTFAKNNYQYRIKFREITTRQKNVGRSGGLFKSIHIIFYAEERQNRTQSIYEKWLPNPLEGLIIQANHNPETLGLPNGEFFEMDGDVKCRDCDPKYWGTVIPCRKRAPIHVAQPTIFMFHHLMKPHKYIYSKELQHAGKRPELHTNFRWYSPPCSETRRIQFLVLAVRSFRYQQYDVFTLGPYEVQIRGQQYQSDIHPSPYFTYFTEKAICHQYSSTDIQTEHPPRFQPFEMSSKFACCLKHEDNPRSPEMLAELSPYPTYSCKHAGTNFPLKIEKGSESYQCFFPPQPKVCPRDSVEKARKVFRKCLPCPQVPTSTTDRPTSTEPSIIKRSVHGRLMIMTNFCLQPIVIYIARFYKETFHLQTYKGVKLWYWMHMLGGGISSSMIYFGYFYGSEITYRSKHTIIGNIYIVTLVLCYVTSWGRHKHPVVNAIAEFVHGCLGYLVIILALACVETAPIGFTSKLLVYLMIAVHLIFMLLMTCHICILDHKFGMRPRRRQFPTVEACFDEVPVPQAKFRIVLLIIFSFMTFSLSFASTFFE